MAVYATKPLVSIVDENGVDIYIFPEPSSFTATTSTLVDSARNSKGVVIGSVVKDDVEKIELSWKYLTITEWAEILNIFNENFYNYVKFFAQDTGDFIIRKMYVNDRKSGMWRRDPDTEEVLGWTDCKLSLIDTGTEVDI